MRMRSSGMTDFVRVVAEGEHHNSQLKAHRHTGFDQGPEAAGGYSCREGGVLSRIRALPEAIVPFREFKKASGHINKVQLHNPDEGYVLDFWRASIAFPRRPSWSGPCEIGRACRVSEGEVLVIHVD